MPKIREIQVKLEPLLSEFPEDSINFQLTVKVRGWDQALRKDCREHIGHLRSHWDIYWSGLGSEVKKILEDEYARMHANEPRGRVQI